MHAMTFEQSMQFNDELAYINIPVSILKYCIKNISRSALVLWEELRDITKYKKNWKAVITNRHLGVRIGRSAHTAYVLLKELVNYGLLVKTAHWGKACTLMLRYPEALKEHPVLKSNTPFIFKGGNKDRSLYINNNYVNSSHNTTAMEDKVMNEPDKWPEMKENCLKKIQEAKQIRQKLEDEHKKDFGMLVGESGHAYTTRIMSMPPEMRLKNQDNHLKRNRIDEYINSRFVELGQLNARLNGGKEEYAKATNKYPIKKAYKPYQPYKKFNGYGVPKSGTTQSNRFGGNKYAPEYE
jgi:hypothetical protein